MPAAAMQDTPALDAQTFKAELLALVAQIDASKAPLAVPAIFDALRDLQAEAGPDHLLLKTICDQIGLDPAVAGIYLKCPELTPIMERLRRGEPVRRVRVSLAISREGRTWFRALLIVHYLYLAGGAATHSHIVRKLSFRAVTAEVSEALAYLREAGLVETVKVPSTDPARPITWHKLTVGAVAEMGVSVGNGFRALAKPEPLAFSFLGKADKSQDRSLSPPAPPHGVPSW